MFPSCPKNILEIHRPMPVRVIIVGKRVDHLCGTGALILDIVVHCFCNHIRYLHVTHAPNVES